MIVQDSLNILHNFQNLRHIRAIIPDFTHHSILFSTDIGDRNDIEGNMQYWCNMSYNDRSKMEPCDLDQAELSFSMETQHFGGIRQMCYMTVRDPRISSPYENAKLIPMWAKAIYIE